jgi:serine/threonine-protein kinase
MATVYRARDLSLERDVALKVLPAEFLHDAAFAERFKQEARVAARLEHPHIVPVHGFGIKQGAPWMAMRLITGGSLADRVRRGPLAPGTLAALLRDVAGALDYAHDRGVVHRDVKPANVLLDEGGRAYLADFGIARMLEGSAVVTTTGMIQGTPSYMAPEQAMGEKVDRLADVYALGVVAFECLTGRVPYTGTTPVAVLMKHVQEPVPEPSEAEVARPLAAVLRRGLAKAKTDRWPSAGAFAEALSEAATGVTPVALESLPTLDLPRETVEESRATGKVTVPTPTVGRSWAWALAGAGALLLLLVGGAALLSSRPPVSAPVGTPLVADAAAPATASSTPPPTLPSATAAPAPKPTETPRPVVSATPRPQVTAPTPTPASPPPPTPRPTPVSTPASTVGVTADLPSVVEPPRPATPPPAAPAAARTRSGPVRVYLEAKLEPVMFQKAHAKDVADSLKDLREAIPKRDRLELVDSRSEADAVVQVLERGREPAVIGVRKLRVRVLLGGETVELVGQDSMVTGFNTWSGAAGGTAKQVETWLARRLGSAGGKGSR